MHAARLSRNLCANTKTRVFTQFNIMTSTFSTCVEFWKCTSVPCFGELCDFIYLYLSVSLMKVEMGRDHQGAPRCGKISEKTSSIILHLLLKVFATKGIDWVVYSWYSVHLCQQPRIRASTLLQKLIAPDELGQAHDYLYTLKTATHSWG